MIQPRFTCYGAISYGSKTATDRSSWSPPNVPSACRWGRAPARSRTAVRPRTADRPSRKTGLAGALAPW